MAFTTEALKALGLNDEQVKGVMAEHGKDVNDIKAELNTANSERDNYKSQVESFSGQLTEAKRQAEKGSEAAKQVEELQTQLKESQTKAQQDLLATQKAYELDGALQKAGARNTKAVQALLDTDKVELKDGKLTGLDDQLKAVKESNAFLFADQEQGTKNPRVITPTGNPDGGGNEPNLTAKIAHSLSEMNK